MDRFISCSDAVQELEKGAVIVDVMTPEDFEVSRIEGAKNACIYEVVFLDRIAECAPDRDAVVIVYDASATTMTAQYARERLLRAGYRHVFVLTGGLEAWKEAGLPVETGDTETEAPLLKDGIYLIDPEKSRLEWTGRSLNYRHHGTIAVQGGELALEGGKPKRGRIILDMHRIDNTDIQDPTLHDLLLHHLKSEDFFAVDRFPTASFTLTGWEPKDEGGGQTLSGLLTGDLAIRDVTRPVTFPATIGPEPGGGLKAHAAFEIDRTLWSVCYGSSRLFERLGMHWVHDMINLEMFIVSV